MAGPVALLRRWWPIPALLTLSLVIQKTLFESRYDASGHAAGHLGSSTAIFLAFPIVLILFWALDEDRLRPSILGGAVVWLAGLVGVLVGNVRVVTAIGTADWTLEEADRLGSARPGFDSGHDLAQTSSFVAVVGALLLIASVWRARAVSGRVAILCAALSVLFPPWIFPGAGVVVLTIAVVRNRQRAEDEALRDAYDQDSHVSEDTVRPVG
jgi:hypothetical protein